MISMSKSGYHEAYPTHAVVFNANVCTADGNKVWYGDLDLTLDEPKLKQLARTLDTTVYVLSEMDGRFENEQSPLLDRFVYCTDGGIGELGDIVDTVYEFVDGVIYTRNRS